MSDHPMPGAADDIVRGIMTKWAAAFKEGVVFRF